MLGSIVGNILGGVLGGGIQTGIDRGNTGRNIRFQRSMAQNKIRWAMEDMRKGGINPILAAQGGLGAGAGTGGASAQTSSAPDMGGLFHQGVNTALDVQMQERKIREINVGIDKIREEMWLITEQTSTENFKQLLLDMEQGLMEGNISVVTENAAILREQLKGWEIEGDIDKTALGKISRALKRITGALPSLGFLVGGSSARSGSNRGAQGTRPYVR